MAWDWKLIGTLSSAAPDCRPEPSQTSPALRWSVIAIKLSRQGGSAGCYRGQILQKSVKMYVNTSFFEVMSEVQEDLENVSAGIDKLTSGV